MKIFKFIPAALALVAFASCSSDDLLGEKAPEQEMKTVGNINIAPLVEDGDITRQGNTPGSTFPVWQAGDVLRTYEAKPTTYDKYAYNATSTFFEGCNDDIGTPGTTNLDGAAKFALFPSKNVDYAGYRDGKVVAVVNIPQLIIYDEDSEFENSDKLAYASNIPMWGTVDQGAYPKVDAFTMYYLTSALRVNIQNAFAKNTTFLKIETSDGQPISGAFEAELSTTDPSSSKLQKGTTALTTHNTMYVDLREAPRYLSNIYLPIIADAYEWLKVSVTSVDATTATPLPANSDQIIADLEAHVNNTGNKTTGWQTIRTYYNSTPFTKGKFKAFSSQTQYKLDNVTTCEMLSKALKQYADYDLNNAAATSLVLNVGGTTGLEISREGDVDDYTIYVPEMNVTDVTINIPAGIKADYTNAKIVVKDENIKKTFKDGKLIIKAGDGSSTPAVNTHDLDFEINLPETSLTLAGDFDATEKLKNIDIKNVKDFSIGDGSMTTEINSASTITVGAAKSVTVADNATCATELDVTATKNIEKVVISGKQTADIETYKANVFVLGEATDIYNYHSQATTAIGATATEGAADAVATGKVANIYTVGNVYIANKTESEAVSGEISVLANNTITLKQGYVKKIAYDVKTGSKFATPSHAYYVKALNALSAADRLDKLVTLNLDGICGDGLTAIAEIEDVLLEDATSESGKVYNYLKMTESKWGGKTINASTYSDYVAAAALAKIYTASELATIGSATTPTGFTLYNQINLDNKNWTNPNLTVAFSGKDPRFANAQSDKHKSRIEAVTTDGIHTIKNLNIYGRTADSYGLFGEVKPTSAIDVKDFIIDGVKCDISATARGTLAGMAGIATVAGIADASTAAVTFSGITVKGTTGIIGSASAYGNNTDDPVGVTYVGGLVGQVKGTNNVTISGNSITVPTIKGQCYLGGLVGGIATGATATTAIDGNTVNLTSGFETSVKPGDLSVIYTQYGTVGMILGQAVGTVTIGTTTVNTVSADKITGNRGDLGFRFNFMTADATTTSTTAVGTAGVNQVKYDFYGGNTNVGYSPAYTGLTIKESSTSHTMTAAASSKYCCFNKTNQQNLTYQNKLNDYIRMTNWAE